MWLVLGVLVGLGVWLLGLLVMLVCLVAVVVVGWLLAGCALPVGSGNAKRSCESGEALARAGHAVDDVHAGAPAPSPERLCCSPPTPTPSLVYHPQGTLAGEALPGIGSLPPLTVLICTLA